MATTSTVPTVKAALVSLLGDALDVDVFWCWQPDVQADCCFLGRAITDLNGHDRIEITYEYPTAELNVPRFEVYTIPVSVWSWRGDLSPNDAKEAETELYGRVDTILGVLADVDLGVADVSSQPTTIPVERRENNAGWVVWAVVEVSVRATLT